MKKTLLIILLLSSIGFVVNAKTLSIRIAAGAITLDGNGEEDAWTAPAFNDMDQIKGDAANKNNTAKFKMTYDADFVYVYVEVLDSKIDTSQSVNVWEKDCIEVFFSLDTTNLAYSNGANSTFQLRKVFGRDMTDFSAKGFKAEEQDIAGGKSQEWQVSFDSLLSTLNDCSKWDGKNFRFEIQNGDNDAAGRNSQLFWNSNADDQWNHTKNMGYVVTEYFCLRKSGCVRDIKQSTPILSFIKVLPDHLEFAEKSDFYIYNSAGILVFKGYKSLYYSTSSLKKGIYLVKANNDYAKFIK